MTMTTARHLTGCGLLALAVAALPDRPLNAWGASGHRVVARIAWERMTPAARSRANDLLESGGADAFIAAATWADEVRSARPETYNWHFVDIRVPFDTYVPARDCPPTDRGDCVIAALARLRTTVVDAARPAAERTEALKFIIHFVGDLHQPLHATDNNDRGGNDVRVFPLRAEDGRNTNLHAVWDTGLINLSTETELARAGRLLAGVQARPVDVLGLDVERWVLESNRAGREAVYAYPSFKVGAPGADPIALDEAYRTTAVAAIDRQLQVAGVRLGALMSSLFDPQAARSGNPVFEGRYADPEVRVFENQYWIYPTYSAPYGEQTFLDAFSSTDLVTWTKHPRILDIANVKWATRAVWAPSIVERDGWYYLFFSANDIQSDREVGGLGIARSRRPEGPFADYLGKPLVGKFENGAQPIDPFVFKDPDGSFYLIYGGWRHCNIAKLKPDFTGFVPFPDGSTFKEIIPDGYVEGSFMFVKDGRYYFMWSEGGWTGPNYAVAYAVADSPLGPFKRVGKVLQQDPSVATGAGHHSILQAPRSGNWYIVYHRRPLGQTDRNNRVVCIDELRFDKDGAILPVVITKEGVARDPVKADFAGRYAPGLR
jgi:hypothetical protein